MKLFCCKSVAADVKMAFRLSRRFGTKDFTFVMLSIFSIVCGSCWGGATIDGIFCGDGCCIFTKFFSSLDRLRKFCLSKQRRRTFACVISPSPVEIEPKLSFGRKLFGNWKLENSQALSYLKMCNALSWIRCCHDTRESFETLLLFHFPDATGHGELWCRTPFSGGINCPRGGHLESSFESGRLPLGKTLREPKQCECCFLKWFYLLHHHHNKPQSAIIFIGVHALQKRAWRSEKMFGRGTCSHCLRSRFLPKG